MYLNLVLAFLAVLPLHEAVNYCPAPAAPNAGQAAAVTTVVKHFPEPENGNVLPTGSGNGNGNGNGGTQGSPEAQETTTSPAETEAASSSLTRTTSYANGTAPAVTSGTVAPPEATTETESSSAPPTSSPTETSPPPTLDEWEQAILDFHNQGREAHQAPPLTWSSTLASYAAQVIADEAPDCAVGHSGGPYGENIAIGYADIYTGMHVWYDEGSKYDYSNPGFSAATGHFTQMVWVNSKQLGCAHGQCASGQLLVVCEYDPRGNIYSDFANNVLPED